ncbi:hypothetical protein GCM10017044_27330 [Kordiimonas sediminis]|uniref:peptidylprolyl isomerase n=1 Tax=Kordiimonas sediminis TaxID=1735581 RepID=A0A919AXK4_9PROT|nr:peptidylprolyl isomerase [Kordiimonas sediminis]GHF30484.1 hypothetical protein GCM10017044_27330 [Kordiimonas sediminis]
MKNFDGLMMTAAVVGIGLAIFGSHTTMDAESTIERTGAQFDPALHVAVVNGVPVFQADLDKILTEFAATSGETVTDTDLERLRDQLINEQLMVQRADELGLYSSDDRVRAAAIEALTDLILTSEVKEGTPSAVTVSEIQAYYDLHQSNFNLAPTISFDVAYFLDEDARDTAMAAVENGANFTEIQESATKSAFPVPDRPIAVPSLKRYVGEDLAHIMELLAEPGISGPYQIGEMYAIINVTDITQGRERSLEEVFDLVRHELEREREEAALKKYIQWLQDRADIVRTQSADEAGEPVS